MGWKKQRVLAPVVGVAGCPVSAGLGANRNKMKREKNLLGGLYQGGEKEKYLLLLLVLCFKDLRALQQKA